MNKMPLKTHIITPLLLVSLAAQCLPTRAAEVRKIDVPIADGPCDPTWRSLGDHFKQPKWWREAKIGMWLHWGPQSVGEDGDWYAKWIYMPREAWGAYSRVYPHHLQRFGHPSEFGYKDALLLWKAEKWDPDKLMALYKRAGARYVIGQGMHHDNFDLWNSKYQPWNSVKIGPQRDILGRWEKAARAHGIRFGIAFHGDYSLWWYQPAFLHDLDGPQKGVPYDAAQNYDGKQTWWKDLGLDLKDLYGIDLKEDVDYPADKKSEDERTAFRFRDPLSHGIPNGDLKVHRDFAVWYATKWTKRVMDAIDQFSPDFIYFDGGGSYPFCGHGTGKGLRADATPRVIAHLYNKSIAEHGGKLEAMAFTKGNEDSRAVAVNIESSFPANIKQDCTWQTENGLGEWFYLKGTFYDSGMVIHQMLEAISRDGNYAINIPLTPAGELDPGGLKTLQDMGDWMDVNSEGIHGSSAWEVWGEGQIVMKSGNLNQEHAQTPYTGKDIRFTTKNGAVYAFLMAWPAEGKAVIRSLAEGAGKVTGVALLGNHAMLNWKQTAEGLTINLPTEKPGQFAYGLKITGENLKAVPLQASVVTPAADGSLTLTAEAAEPHGGVRAENRTGQVNLGYWNNPQDWVSWQAKFTRPGKYRVFAQTASPNPGVPVTLEAGDITLTGKAPQTASHDEYATLDFGTLEVKKSGIQTIKVRPGDASAWKAINLRAVRLQPGTTP
jgi:alpha-L-fucosidase